MLSINIPVYNIEVVKLVRELSRQAAALQIKYEVRVYDDGSDEIFKSINRSISQIPNVAYVELVKNLGRSAIRNKMGFESEYENLLFIDADSKVVKTDYLECFIEHCQADRIVCGGRSYSSEKPDAIDKIFHWCYGTKREAVSASRRNRSKGFILMSNNFLIGKNALAKIKFREELREYGHEDTLLGYDLFMNGYEIFHIDNPLEHTGLESTTVFLRKSKLALVNLKYINEHLLTDADGFATQVNFLKHYHRITSLIPGSFLAWLFNGFEKRIEKNLNSRNPNLRCFDFYKLGYYSTLKNR